MSKFTLIASGVPVEPLLGQVDANPYLWGSRGARQRGNSPHREATDIWLRYMAPELFGRHDINTRHESVWYPEAHILTGVHGIVHRLRHEIGVPLELGGVLMTRIPGGKEVYWHNDCGAWHAEYYDLKCWLPLRANDQCVNHVEDESMVWRVGDAYSHSNMLEHRVENRGETERICLIVCFRRI